MHSLRTPPPTVLRDIKKVHNFHGARTHQVFTRVQIFSTISMGKTTGNKPKCMKCGLETWSGVNIIPLSIYQYISLLNLLNKVSPLVF